MGGSCGKLVAVENEGGKVETIFVGLQVGSELAMSRQLHHNPDWGLTADADQLDDVLMVKLLHDVRLLQKLLGHCGISFHFASLHSY